MRRSRVCHLTHRIVRSVACMHLIRARIAHTAFHALVVTVALRSALPGGIRDAVHTFAALVTHRVVRGAARLRLILVSRARCAVQANEVGAALRTAIPRPVALADLAAATVATHGVVGGIARTDLELVLIAQAFRISCTTRLIG